jgi:hypothetical protein
MPLFEPSIAWMKVVLRKAEPRLLKFLPQQFKPLAQQMRGAHCLTLAMIAGCAQDSA